jgi:hypothetical protein
MSAKVPPIVLSNYDPFNDPAFLRDYAAERARHDSPYPPPPPAQPAEPVHTGRKTYDTRIDYRHDWRCPGEVAEDMQRTER